MKMKKVLASLLLFTLFTGVAHAKVTEQQALADQRIAPYVEATKQQGANFLTGRYVYVKEILSRFKPSEKINAATSMIIEVSQFNSENNAYPVVCDVYGENLSPAYMTLDNSGAVPIIRTYAADDAGNYEVVEEDFAVVMADDNKKYSWLLASTDTGEVSYMFPLNDFWFPDKWYEGEWLGNDGSEIELDDDGDIEIQDKKFGTYIISDNRVAVKTPDGQRDVIYCIYNPYNKTLVMTFTSGPNGMGENAGVFVKDDDDDDDDAPKSPKISTPKENSKPQAPVFKAPGTSAPTTSKPAQPTAPQQFPKFPVSAPEISLEGVWQAYLNGQQLVLQFQGNNYYVWVNGQPAEMGTFQRQGNVLTGTISGTGAPFRNTINFDSTGKNFTMTDSNNFSITYQRVQ